MKLTPRLEKIAELVDEGATIIDVGTDHGYIPAYLTLNRFIKSCIASDINQGPLKAAQDTIKEMEITDYVKLRLGSGLEVVRDTDTIDTVIIAGMGGETIVSILENRPMFMEDFTLIIQPMTEVPLVRRYLEDNNWEIVDEDVAQEDRRYYEIIKAVRIKDKKISYTYKELRFGPILLKKKSTEFISYLKRQLEKSQIILENMKKGFGIDNKVANLESEINLIQEVLRKIESTRDNTAD